MFTKVLSVLGLVLSLSQAASANTCAVVYQGENFTGYSLTLRDGAHVNDLGIYPMDSYRGENWNNRVSSVYVAPHCRLVGFQYNNFGRDYRTGERIGERAVYRHGQYPYIGTMNDLMSSVKCSCKY